MPFTKNKAKVQVLLMNNISAVTYINKMRGTHSFMLSYLTKNMWDWCTCFTHNVLVTAQYIPGVQNVDADRESRVFLSGFQRLETTFGSFHPSPSQVGSPEHRPLSLPTLLSFREQASRPSSNSRRCIYPGLGKFLGLRLSSICSDRPMPPPNSEPTGVTLGVCSTSLANPTLYLLLLELCIGFPLLLPVQEDLLT